MSKYQSTNSKSNDRGLLNLIVLVATLITISLTPWINSDSLIIPKGIILFLLAIFLVPKLIVIYLKVDFNFGVKIITTMALLFLIQMILIIFITSPPWEQQFFGRTGRGLGFATYFSLLILFLIVCFYSSLKDARVIGIGLVLSTVISSIYSIMQSFGFDIFQWVTQTNGIIGTLGNPNFQSSLIAMAVIPTATVFIGKRMGNLISFFLLAILLYTLYRCESIQGYIASLISISVFTLIFLWYKRKSLFFSALFIFIILGLVTLAGMLKIGPLSVYLYKASVQSRGEMWRTAISTIKENPIFGVGLDSFGDYSLRYRDLRTVNGVNEYADNAHNFFLQAAVTGGLVLAFLHLALLILGLLAFIKFQRNLKTFDKNVASIFASWLSYQAQSIISPSNISMLVWNYILSGFLISLAFNLNGRARSTLPRNPYNADYSHSFGYLFLVFGLVTMYPWFNADRVAFSTTKTGNALVAIEAAKMYPESSIRYSRIGVELYKSNLFEQSLDVARSAVEFNPNSVQGWFLILINEKASLTERQLAKIKILELDPFNSEVEKFNL